MGHNNSLKKKKESDREKIAHLRREVRDLKRENRRLLELYEQGGADSESGAADDALAHQGGVHRLMNSGSYFSYLTGFIRSSSPYRIWNRVLRYSRRFRLLSGALRMSARVVAIIETSAVLLLFASVAIVLVPVLLVLALIGIFAAMFENKKTQRQLTDAISRNILYVFFPVRRSQIREDSFFLSGLRELSRRENCTVLAVSPSVFSYGGAPFLSSKKLDDNLYLIRRHFFFRLRKSFKSRRGDIYLIY